MRLGMSCGAISELTDGLNPSVWLLGAETRVDWPLRWQIWAGSESARADFQSMVLGRSVPSILPRGRAFVYTPRLNEMAAVCSTTYA